MRANDFEEVDIETGEVSQPIIETRMLKHDFSPAELEELGSRLATKILEVKEVQEQKKSAAADFKAKIDTLTELISRLSNCINFGFENRNIECTVKYHKPKHGLKLITRIDTNESWQETMSTEEYTLFNQD